MPPKQTEMSRRSLDSVSVVAVVATIAAVLVIFTPFISVPIAITKTFVFAVGTLITLAIYILARLVRGNVIFPPLLLLGALWLPVIAYSLSALFSGVKFSQALWGSGFELDTFGFILAAACFGTLSALIVRRPEQYRVFFKSGAYALGILSAFQVAVILVGQVAPKIVLPSFSIVGSISDLASLLGLGVVATLIGFRFLELSDNARRVLLISGALALAVIAVANSLLVWILIALVSFGLFVEAIMQSGPKSDNSELDEQDSLDLEGSAVVNEAPLEDGAGNRSLILPLAVLAISSFFIIGSSLGIALANSLNVNIASVRPSWQSTLTVTQRTYATSPIFGSGPSTFGAAWLKNRDAAMNSTIFWNVDFNSGFGFIPTSLVTTGIVGAVAWVLLFGLFIWFGLRTLILRAPTDTFIRYAAIVSFVATVYLFVIAVFSVPGTLILVLAFAFAGIFVSTTRFAGNGAQWGIIFSRSPRIGFVIVFVLTILLLSSVVAGYSLAERYIASVELSRATSAITVGDLDVAEKAAQSSISFAPSAVAYQVQAVAAIGRINNVLTSTTMDRETAANTFATALRNGISAAKSATNLDESNYQSWMALGNLYAQAVPHGIDGSYVQAKEAYDKAIKLNPTNPQLYYALAQLDMANKDTKSAKEDLITAINLKQDYSEAIFLLSQLEIQNGNVKGALDAALAAAYFTPNNPNILFQVGILYAAQNDLANAAAALSAAVTANPQFANAHYFLSAVYAKQGDFAKAIAHLEVIASMSSSNAGAVAQYISDLKAGKNPYPSNILTISSTPVQ